MVPINSNTTTMSKIVPMDMVASPKKYELMGEHSKRGLRVRLHLATFAPDSFTACFAHYECLDNSRYRLTEAPAVRSLAKQQDRHRRFRVRIVSHVK